MKKGQAQQVFVFILAVVLTALILLFGYRAISKMMVDIDKAALIEFKTEIDSEVRNIATNYESVKKVEFNVPTRFTRVCILQQGFSSKTSTAICMDSNPPKNDSDVKFGGDFDDDYNPVICNMWPDNSEQDNVFLLPLGESVSINTMNIKIYDNPISSSKQEVGYICLKPRSGRIELRLEGKGNHTVVSRWPTG